MMDMIGATPLSGYKFAHAISLGSHCYTSAVFKRLYLRQYSGPFDWMFTTPPMVQACIESDFEQFLDRRYYEPFPWEGKTTRKHTFYDTHWQANFTHYDPATDDAHAYLVRCVDRFRRVLASSDPNLCLFITSIHEPSRNEYVEHFTRLAATINSRTNNATVIGITVTMTGADPAMVEAAAVGSNRLFHYTSASLLQGIAFANAEDDRRIDRFVLDLVGA